MNSKEFDMLSEDEKSFYYLDIPIVAEYLFNLPKFRWQQYDEGVIFKEIIEYHDAKCKFYDENKLTQILNEFNKMMEENSRKPKSQK